MFGLSARFCPLLKPLLLVLDRYFTKFIVLVVCECELNDDDNIYNNYLISVEVL
jgi:hypothetical protein